MAIALSVTDLERDPPPQRQPQHRLRQRAPDGQLRLEIAQLGTRRQPAMPQQEADLFECRLLREIVDVESTIGEHASIAVQVADRGRRRNGIFEPGFRRRGRCHTL